MAKGHFLPPGGARLRGTAEAAPRGRGRTPARSHVTDSPAGARARSGAGGGEAARSGPSRAAPGRQRARGALPCPAPPQRHGPRPGAAAPHLRLPRPAPTRDFPPLPSGGHSPYYSPHRKRRRHAKPEEAEEAPVATATSGPVRPCAAADVMPHGSGSPFRGRWSGGASAVRVARPSPFCPSFPGGGAPQPAVGSRSGGEAAAAAFPCDARLLCEAPRGFTCPFYLFKERAPPWQS